MKIGLVGQFAYECSIEKYYLRALKALGHKVVLDVNSIISGAQKVDLTIVVKWFKYPDMLPHPRVLIFTDLTTRFKEYYESVEKYYDYVFLVHNEKDLIDNKRVFYLPVAFCPQEHYMIEGLEKDIDCLLIATAHPSRAWLKDIGTITRYGNEWGDTHDVYGDEYRVLCSRAKIIVNHHFVGDTTNMRDYEAMNFKALILTDKTPFTAGKDVIRYWNPEDLKEKIEDFLEDDCWNYNFNNPKFSYSYMGEVIRNGYNTIKQGKFKYSDRITELLNIIAR